MTARYAIIPTHNRPTELARLIDQLQHDVDDIIVIDNASDPPLDTHSFALDTHARLKNIRILHDNEQPPHLYRMWNEGFAEVESCVVARRESAWDVAVFNDDAIIPSGWFDIVANGLRKYDVAVASTASVVITTSDKISHVIGENGIIGRMCPWAFIMRGELNLRADEQFRWWWGDSDFDWMARQHGGVAILAGPVVQNEHANSTTHGKLAEQAGRDGVAFAAKWGKTPW
jgi:GT2 family glycosyltransferase